MSWLTEKMTAQQRYVWERRADIDVALAGTTRWTRLSELPTDQFEAARQALGWIDEELGSGASTSVLRLMLPTADHSGCAVALSRDVLSLLGIPEPAPGRHLCQGRAVDITLTDEEML